MRKLAIAAVLLALSSLLSILPSVSFAATTASHPTSTSGAELTPQQARNALSVLNDPQKRAQVADALAAPASATESASAAVSASSATAASCASGVLAKSLTANGLASQVSRQAGNWMVKFGTDLRASIAALLNGRSVAQWWHDRTATPQARAIFEHVFWAVLLSLMPAFLIEYLCARFLRKPRAKIAARGVADAEVDDPGLVHDEKAAVRAEQAAERTGDEVAIHVAERKVESARGQRHAARHWTLLQRLPNALFYLLLKFVPLAVFIGVATLLMSIVMEDNTTEAHVASSIIDVYLICRAITIMIGFFLAPHAKGLRLLQMRDDYAIYTYRRLRSIVLTAGIGIAIANGFEPLGLSDAARIAILKIVTLDVHLVIAWTIYECRKPVADRIRGRMEGTRSTALVGSWVADVWAGVAIFFVIALWFVWALDVQNGYRTLFHLGGVSLLVLIGARVAAIVAFGALGRVFHDHDDEDFIARSIAHQHAYRYYPILRRAVQTVIAVVTVIALLEVWVVHIIGFFTSGGVGNKIASALVTIAIAAIFAVLVWETANVMVEKRLDEWNTSGDRVRAARLRTLLPMMRTALFILIAMVVVLTGLSELGVNTAPLLASASIFGVALGFGSQKLVQDFITGIFLLMENAMQVGDWVTVAGVSGTVEYLSIRTVRLRGGDGSLYTVPFSSVSTVNNTNRGIGNAAVRVSIALGQDVDLAISTLKDIGTALREDPAFRDGILSDFSFWGVDAVDGSTVTLAGQIQCRDSARWPTQREFNRRILNEFTAKGIEIANPQRNFVIVGGGENGAHEGQQDHADADVAGADQRGEPSKAAQHPTNEAQQAQDVAANVPPPRASGKAS
ncbi:Potassium efflux system KefA protein / Small-conductance mechanosensitive channel [Candidatus Burkholderia verschuerenii]|uniref:Potassium efflux system KefA protein / Small-conductance mechanosensitive channel n=1 Tax=Candidatus Burkholderia verschuerenii TaxID=242163 RepID=A0A0L0M8B9_9BURK|nr:mechanosensitive ion channel domain-containing protein [Candidatus Burkholderia verschuerenii]KND58540.1 Potassium efflux system KefA protein / Small-conductance mechanosensitive channel [Candidatus Burkholderia verschuerenii]